MRQHTKGHASEAETADAQRPRNDDAKAITDSFHWDIHEGLGVIVLGAVVFVLLRALIRTYERLLQAYAAGYAPR